MSLEGLNEPQAEAVAHVDGPLLVFAGAGSGKTRVITYRIANLVARHAVPPYRVLAVTFTNKAAGEMRARLKSLLGDEVAKDLWVGTFHATCARLIRRHHAALGLTRDFVIYDDADQRGVVTRIVREQRIDDKRYPPRMLLSQIHKHKQEGTGPSDVVPSTYVDDVVIKVFAAYEANLRASNACDFDDLLLHVLRLVELPDDDPSIAGDAGRALRRQFNHVLVDEFQDTNAVQYRLVRGMVRATKNLAVVGDDDQSIYRWRGADVRNIRGFAQDFPGAHVVRLEQNYRSTARIVRAALGVIAPSKQRVPKELWTENEEGDKIEVRAAADERDEAAQVSSVIEASLRDGWSYAETAILYRTHAQSRVLEEAMRQKRIPYRIVGGLRFFDRAEIKDLLAYLRLVANPRSDVDFLRIVNVPARGIGSTTVERLQATATAEGLTMLDALRAVVSGGLDAGLANAAIKRLGAFLAIMDDLGAGPAHASAATHDTPSELAARALERSGYRAALEAEDTDESETRLQNLEELVGSIRDYEEAARAEGTAPTVTGFLERTALITTADDKDKDGDAKSKDVVTMMTVHAAKGLEYRGVIITGLEDEIFPFKGYRAMDGEEDDSTMNEEADDLEEERRLAYVAVTRAREKLTLLYAAQRTIFGQTKYLRPSRFLKDLPQADLQQRASHRRETTPARTGWGSSPPPSSKRPSSPFTHPQQLPDFLRRSSPPARAEGERFVVLDDDVASGGDVRRGETVRHKRFGEGRVVEVVEGAEPKVVAEFPGWGTMTILRRFLEIVRE